MSGKLGQRSDKAVEIAERYTEGFLEDMDGRRTAARALRDRLHALASDLGGISALSYQEISLCKRVVHLEGLIQMKELSLAQNQKVDELSYFHAITVLSSLLSKLGLRRRARQLPSLSEYLSNKTNSQVETTQTTDIDSNIPPSTNGGTP